MTVESADTEAGTPGRAQTGPGTAEFRQFFELSTDLLCIAGFDGKLRVVSDSCRQILGYEPQEMLAQPFTDRIHPDDMGAVQQALVRLRAGEPLTGFSCRSQHRNGSYRWLYWSARSEAGGDVMYAVGRDITDAKVLYDDLVRQAEDLSTANAGLERASRMKSEFLSNMSHELRTPLNAILGFTELLMDDPDAYDPATRSSFLANVHESGRHLLCLVTDVLELADVQAGRATISASRFEVSELVAEAIALLQPTAAAKRIHLAVGSGQAGEMLADRSKVRQILVKLLSNGLKFSPDEGQVSVTAVRREGEVVFTVADNGPGIDPEDHDRIFEKFQQLDSGNDRRFQGTGLGLALIKAYTELHGGRLEVESRRGEGSRFTAVLPATTTVPASLPRGIEQLEQSASLSDPEDPRPVVLMVDDEDHTAQLLVGALEEAGYRWARAVNGQSALRRAQELRPAVITLDVMMPDLDGWQVLRLLKTHPATRDIPVVMVSRAENEVLGRALGAIDHVMKPVNPAHLLASLAGLSLGPAPVTGSGRRAASKPA